MKEIGIAITMLMEIEVPDDYSEAQIQEAVDREIRETNFNLIIPTDVEWEVLE